MAGNGDPFLCQRLVDSMPHVRQCYVVKAELPNTNVSLEFFLIFIFCLKIVFNLKQIFTH